MNTDLASIVGEMIHKEAKELSAMDDTPKVVEKTGDDLIDALGMASSFCSKSEKDRITKVGTLLNIAREEILMLRKEAIRNLDDVVDTMFDPDKTEAKGVTTEIYRGDTIDQATPQASAPVSMQESMERQAADLGEPFSESESAPDVAMFSGGQFPHEQSPAYKRFVEGLSKY